MCGVGFCYCTNFFCNCFCSRHIKSYFSDLPQNHWAYNAVKFMVERGIITGYPDNTFRPDNPVTRAEFARIMVVALNLPIKVTDTPSFKDVPKDHWAYPYVESAKYYLTGFRTAMVTTLNLLIMQ